MACADARELRDALQPLRAASNGSAPPSGGAPPALPPRERVSAAAGLAAALVAPRGAEGEPHAAAAAEANGGPADADRLPAGLQGPEAPKASFTRALSTLAGS